MLRTTPSLGGYQCNKPNSGFDSTVDDNNNNSIGTSRIVSH